MGFYITNNQKNRIREIMNPKGHNQKDVNFFKVLGKRDGRIKLMLGYWITYRGCKPKYEKIVTSFLEEEISNPKPTQDV